MTKEIKDVILMSVRDSIRQASEFMEEYERRLTKNEWTVNEEIDAKDYAWWSNYRNNLVKAHRVVSKIEVEDESNV